MVQDHPTNYAGVIVRLRDPSESAMFVPIVKEALNKIYSKKYGKRLLDGITSLSGRAKFGYTVCIMRPSSMEIGDKGDGKGIQWYGGSIAIRGDEKAACDGTGSVTAIKWHPNMLSTPDGARPNFIALGHEMIHAWYNLRGAAFLDTAEEEYRTVGIAPRANTRSVNENKMRGEHGVPLRIAYTGLAPPG